KDIKVEYVGPPATSRSLIKANIQSREGETFNPEYIDDDVRNLYKTGYFYNIRVGQDRTDEGVTLTYVVQGKPVLTDIQFSGNEKFDRKDFMKNISSKTGEPLDEKKLFFDTRAILKMYQKKGFYRTKVDYTLSIDEEAGRGSVTFEITESPKVKIERIDFPGAEAFSEGDLRDVIETHRRWLFSWLTGSGYLKEDVFEEDKQRLVVFYKNHGYIDFTIEDIEFDYIDPKWMVVKISVNEGKQYHVGNVEFEGNELFSDAEILEGVRVSRRTIKPGMTIGEVFSPKGLSADISAIEDIYGSKGYIDVNIIAHKRPNIETGTMDLVYEVIENDRSYIERIDIKGNVKTKDKVIRRELAVTPGEVFDITRVDLSEQRLRGLNYFSKVETKPEPTDVPERKDLVVAVEEKNTGNFVMGAGFSTVDDVVGYAEVTQGNFDLFRPPYFTGGGQKFRLRTQLGTKRQDYLLSFIEPWFMGRKLKLGVDLYHRELNFLSDVFDERRTGAKVGLTRTLGSDYLVGGVSYTIENIGIVNVDHPRASNRILEEEGNRLVSKMGLSISYDTRDNAMMPTRGQRTELLTELAGGPFAGETDFYKLELHSAWYFQGLMDSHIIEVLGRTGVVENYGGSDRVPLFDRWFLGGMYSLRGYDYREVGPRDNFNEPIGGNTYWFGSVEYSVPIIERLRFAVFYDIGMVYRDAYRYDFDHYNDNWGVGFRLNLPIGPLRFDYGIPITSDPENDGSGRFNFGIGYTREF
ncbi:MAG: outer membrane protein assembly factor BamA, partial [Verrucomicrobia bacterium]|nr:outer membrane protein assembly factor BamA [Verrucomicrobiota bacterium]